MSHHRYWMETKPALAQEFKIQAIKITRQITGTNLPEEDRDVLLQAETKTFTFSAGSTQSSHIDLLPTPAILLPGAYVRTEIDLLPVEFKKMWETPNKANQVLNKTKKDDDTGNTSVLEHDGDASYAVPRNNLYVVADSADNKIKVSLDVGLPESLRTKFIAAAYDGATKVQNSDKAFPAAVDQPAALEFPITGNTAKEYEIKIGYDKNSNNLLDSDEAIQLEVYKHKPDNAPRYLIVKGISNDKYAAHKQTIEQKITLYGTQSQPSLVAKYARSFLSIFYYKADFSHIATSVAPTTTTATSLNAFANGQGFAEWLTHNSGAAFSDEGVADIKNYGWAVNSEVSEFFALRTPFALESTMSNSQGYFELPTPTGTALKAFYDAHVKTGAEAALQNSAIGATLTFPQNGGWYDFPRAENPSLFKSTSPETSAGWVTPSTLVIGKNDGYSGFGALFTDIVAGTEEFKDFDAFGVVGRGRVIGPQYRITVKKEQTGIWPFQSVVYNVSEVRFLGEIQDLYDFNYEDGELPSHAAAMQIGYGKGSGGTARDRGLIYRHRIQIDHIYSYPFDQIAVPNF